MRSRLIIAGLAALLGGCGLLHNFEPRPDAARPADGGGLDAGDVDAGRADASADAGAGDAGREDAGPFDAGTPCTTHASCDPTPLGGGCVTSVCLEGVCVAGDADLDGVGPGCARGDCDDDDASIGADALLACDTAGLGVCGRGAARMCRDGIRDALCIGESVSTDELCDGLDNDCDGAVDEDVAAPDTPAGCGAAQVECLAGTWRVSYETSATADDCTGTPGLDDDCDGSIDEACGAPGPCIYVGPEGTSTSLDPSQPSGALDTITNAVRWIADHADAPRSICLLAEHTGAGCEPIKYSGATIPSGVDIRGNLRAQPGLGGSEPCPGRGATTVGTAAGQTYALDVVGTLPDGNAGPSTFRDFEVQIPGVMAAASVGIRVQVSDRVRLQDLAIAPENLGRAFRSDGVHLESNTDVVLSDTFITTRGTLGSAVVAKPNSQLAVTRTAEARPNSGCTLAGRALIGGGNGWAIEASGARVLMQRGAICPGGRGGVQMVGGALAAVTSGVLGNARTNLWTGIELQGADAFLADFFVAALSATNTTRYVAAEASSTLVLSGFETPGSTPSDGSANALLLDCLDSACLLADSDSVGFEEPNLTTAIGVDCRGDSRCLLHAVSLRTNASGGLNSTALRVHSGARALVRGSYLSGGCSETSRGISVLGGGIVRVERSQVLGTAACTTGSAYGMVASPGAGFDALSSSFSSGLDTDGPCTAARAVAISGAVDGSALRNSVFDGSTCAGDTQAAQIDSSPTVLVAHCGFTMPAQVTVDGAQHPSDLSLLGALPNAFANVYTEQHGFGAAYPTDLGIDATSAFAGAGGGGAPARDLRGRPASEPPAIGAYEP